jgi:adenylylsulfate kinase
MNKNTIWHDPNVKREDRNRLNDHKSGLVWFTGLSASGKSTIAHTVEKRLFEKSIRPYVLDGDIVKALC